jgi:hypothetical protein
MEIEEYYNSDVFCGFCGKLHKLKDMIAYECNYATCFVCIDSGCNAILTIRKGLRKTNNKRGASNMKGFY